MTKMLYEKQYVLNNKIVHTMQPGTLPPRHAGNVGMYRGIQSNDVANNNHGGRCSAYVW